MFLNFKGNLPIPYKEILDNDLNFNTLLFNYLISQSFSSESQTIALQILNQMNSILDLNIDPVASATSPLFVDMSQIGNSTEDLRFKAVFSKLRQSYKFRELISLFEQVNFINARFIVEDIPNPSWHGVCSLQEYSDGYLLNVIKIDKPMLSAQSEAHIAVVIIHEILHAYINVKLRHPSIGMDTSTINSKNFVECMSSYFGNYESHHSFIADQMTPIIVEILMSIKDTLFTPEQIFDAEYPSNGSAILYEPLLGSNPLTISDVQIPWNWVHYFTHLSYMGLQFSPIYPDIYPPGSVQEYYRSHYISAGNAIFTP